jgi:hypothetical protein
VISKEEKGGSMKKHLIISFGGMGIDDICESC